jgi:hypothetical protein
MTFIDKYTGKTLQFAVLSVLLTGTGCKVTETDLETWKETAKGPGKIVAVMSADKYDMPLRVRAAVALVDMERQDVDGVTELQNGLQSLDDESRKQIIAGMVPLLEEAMKKPGDAKDAEGNPTVPPHQIRAKDSAFLLISIADPQTRERLTKDVISWYVEDFEGRSLAGAHSAEQVVRALGAPAATVVVEALNIKLAQPAMVKIAELINDLGNASAKQKAAQKLVAIEREMESDAYLKWLESEVKKQLEKENKKVEQTSIKKMAELNRTNFIVQGVLPAMKYLAGQKAVGDRLLQIASTPGDDKQTDRRVAALQALEGNVNKTQLNELLSLALDSKNPSVVRDYAFDRVGDIRSPDAIAPMWPLVENPKEARLRWRAGELVLGIGGNSVLNQFFSKLPSGDKIEYPPEELEGYAARMSQMTPLPTSAAKAQLGSPDWWSRVIAINFFLRKGTKADVALVENLTGDTAQVKGKGWGKDDTVGSVAKRALASIRERLEESSGSTTATPSK